MPHQMILRGEAQRRLAKGLIDKAPLDAVVTIKPANRTLEQNNKFWAMMSDLSRQKPEGRTYTPEVWRSVMMNSLKYEIQFVIGLSGEPFPMGYSSKALTKAQMIDLIECAYEYGARHGIIWGDDIVSNESIPDGPETRPVAYEQGKAAHDEGIPLEDAPDVLEGDGELWRDGWNAARLEP